MWSLNSSPVLHVPTFSWLVWWPIDSIRCMFHQRQNYRMPKMRDTFCGPLQLIDLSSSPSQYLKDPLDCVILKQLTPPNGKQTNKGNMKTLPNPFSVCGWQLLMIFPVNRNGSEKITFDVNLYFKQCKAGALETRVYCLNHLHPHHCSYFPFYPLYWE